MGKTSKLAKAAALTTALAAHSALAFVGLPKEQASIEGAGGSAEVKLGSSFEDLVTGTLTAETVTEAMPVQPDIATSRPVEATPLAPAQQPVTAAIQPALPALDADAVVAAPVPQKTLTATDETVEPVVRSLRPKPRVTKAVAQKQPTPNKPKTTTAKKAIPEPKGNATKSAIAGKAAGTDTGKAKSSGTGTKKAAAGNAAKSNYDGVVMRKIARTKLKEVKTNGTVTVSFKINSKGGITSISITKPSGSPALDRAAIKQIKRAAPFPKPPAGARQTFNIQIKGK